MLNSILLFLSQVNFEHVVLTSDQTESNLMSQQRSGRPESQIDVFCERHLSRRPAMIKRMLVPRKLA